MAQEIAIFSKNGGRSLPNSPENPIYVQFTGGTGGTGGNQNNGTSLTAEQVEALKNLSQQKTLKKIKVHYFAGKGERKPATLTNNANTTGYFSNCTNYQYTGKKVTAVGFVTGTPGEIEIHIATPGRPLVSEVAARITLKEGTEMQWYPVDIDVPQGKWLAVKCNVGTFKYAGGTTTEIGGNGFVTMTNGFDEVITSSSSSSSYLGFGIEVEETIDPSKPYAGKLFSVIGDSISTYESYISVGNNLYYNKERQKQAGFESVNDTWWKKAIDGLGGLLNTNDAISGSRVSGDGAGWAFLRTNRIDANTDVCLVMIGINDLHGNVPLGTLGAIGATHNRAEITGAFQEAIEKMQAFYPYMEIVLVTNLKRFINGIDPGNANGLKAYELQDRIKEVAKLYGLKCVDLSEIGHNKFTHTTILIDNTHPNKLGMERIANAVIQKLN